MLRFFNFGKGAAGFDNSDHKKQNQQGVSYCLKRAVDIDYDSPDRSTLELFGRFREQRPYLSKLFIPGFERPLKVLYHPVV
jgi:hypothetical protein